MSVPLLIIYFFYCFTYVINLDKSSIYDLSILNNDENNIKKSKFSNTKKTDNNNDQNISQTKTTIPRPIVSYAPKPIKIDSNIIIQIDVEENIISDVSSKKDSLKRSIIEEKNPIIQISTLKLNEIMICRGIYKRNPIKPGYKFINNVDSLFCYTKISNSGPKQEIKHVWFFEDEEISSVIYNIKTSYNYRSWSKKTIYPKQIGNWRVDVVARNGDIIGTRNFSVKSIRCIQEVS